MHEQGKQRKEKRTKIITTAATKIIYNISTYLLLHAKLRSYDLAVLQIREGFQVKNARKTDFLTQQWNGREIRRFGKNHTY